MTVLVDERYYKEVAGMLDALPERVIRFDFLTSLSCIATLRGAGHNLEPAQIIGTS